MPILFVVASATIVVNRLVSDPIDSAIGLAIVAAGIPVFYLSSRRATLRGESIARTAPL